MRRSLVSLAVRLLPLMLLAVCQLCGCVQLSGREIAHSHSLGSLPSNFDTGCRVCQPIKIPMCSGIGYNMTCMPNRFQNENQEAALKELEQFKTLVDTGCSKDLLFFLCSLYVPLCTPQVEKLLSACRSVCERAKRGCAPLMEQFGFGWPERLNCTKLPKYGSDELCMDANHTEVTDSSQSAPSQPLGCSCDCRQPLVRLTEGHQLFNRVSTAGILNCALPCSHQVTDGLSRFATVWLGVWSVLCAVSSSVTVLTFFMDTRRFNYPERPIVMMCGCYVLVSVGYIVGLLAGSERVACDAGLVRYSSSGAWLCTLVFLLTYMFGMASGVWWVVLCVSWFLAAGLKWGTEAIAKYSKIFHWVAWVLPVTKLILVLTFSLVDGDPVSGLCSVGNTNSTALRVFVVGPLLAYLVTGLVFLLAGFVSLFRIRSVMKRQACDKAYKLEKLMIRIGVFSILYTLPGCTVLVCHFYEFHLRQEWLTHTTCGCQGDRGDAKNTLPVPEFWVLMIRQFMQLAVGITAGVWVWSGKTITTWQQFLCRICGCQNANQQRSGQQQQQQQQKQQVQIIQYKCGQQLMPVNHMSHV